jgi:hypothetical protein
MRGFFFNLSAIMSQTSSAYYKQFWLIRYIVIIKIYPLHRYNHKFSKYYRDCVTFCFEISSLFFLAVEIESVRLVNDQCAMNQFLLNLRFIFGKFGRYTFCQW